MNITADTIATSLDAKKTNTGWLARCPAHEDKSPSLSISTGADGKVLMHCFAGCDFHSIVSALKLEAPVKNESPRLASTFSYRDADGKVLYVKERWEPGFNGGRKSFTFKNNGLKGRGGEPVLYNLPAVTNAETIFIVEGEAKADLLNSWGLTATCLDSGAKSPWHERYTNALAGKKIIVLPDHDAPGKAYADNIVKELRGKADIRIVDLPGLNEKEDIVDWARRGGTKDKLAELAREGGDEVEVKTYKREKGAREYPDEILNPPGLLKTIADYYAQTAIRPQPLFGVAAGLAIGSVVLGRRYRTEYRNYTSLYMLVAAKSGTGKDHVKQVVREILKAVNLAWLERSEGFTASNTVVRSLEGQPLQVSFFEEIGLRLQEASQNPRSLARGTFRKLLDIFSSAHSFSVSEEYADRSVHRVDKPALTMVGLTTPRALTGAITESLIEQGFVNRILPFLSSEERASTPLGTSTIDGPPQEVLDWIRCVWPEGNLSEAGVPICPGEDAEVTIPFAPDALDLLNDIDSEVVRRANDLERYKLDDMLSRNREIAMRVALIAAVMDGASTIEARHVKWAWGLTRYLYAAYIDEIRRHVSGSDHERAKLEALESLRKLAPRGLAVKDLPKTRPWSKWNKKLRDEVLAELQEAGLADRERVRTGARGPATEAWVALE